MDSHPRLPYLTLTLLRIEKRNTKKKWGEKCYWKTQWVFRWFPTPYHQPKWVSAPHLSAVLALELLHCWSEDQIWCFCRYWSKPCHVGKNQSVRSPSFSCAKRDKKYQFSLHFILKGQIETKLLSPFYMLMKPNSIKSH